MTQPSMRQVVQVLRTSGALFAYLFGSRATGRPRSDSDADVAAFFGDGAIDPTELDARLPDGVDVLVLDTAPLEIAGRVATQGRLLFEADAPRRVEWEATIRKIYFDERPRIEQARRDFVAGAQSRGRR